MRRRAPQNARVAPEDGIAAPVLLATLVLVATASLAVADVANVLLAHARARLAADAGALAAASAQWPFLDAAASPDPEGNARAIVERNGARLDECSCPLRGQSARVTASVPTRVRILRTAPARAEATATARLDPGRLFAPAPP